MPCQHGILTTTSAEAGQHEIQIRAVLSTENAGETPVLHDWGIFWGEPSYTPENIEIKTATGNLTITCKSSGTVRVPVGFNVVNATINITSILLVADSSMAATNTFHLIRISGYGW